MLPEVAGPIAGRIPGLVLPRMGAGFEARSGLPDPASGPGFRTGLDGGDVEWTARGIGAGYVQPYLPQLAEKQ